MKTIKELEAEGLTTSDAQAVIEAQGLKDKDYGFDPIAKKGFVKMVPSGRILSIDEANRILHPDGRKPIKNDCFGLSWEDIGRMQGASIK